MMYRWYPRRGTQQAIATGASPSGPPQQNQFRVIILQEEPIVKKDLVPKKRVLSAAKIKTKGFKFNRNDANDDKSFIVSYHK